MGVTRKVESGPSPVNRVGDDYLDLYLRRMSIHAVCREAIAEVEKRKNRRGDSGGRLVQGVGFDVTERMHERALGEERRRKEGR